LISVTVVGQSYWLRQSSSRIHSAFVGHQAPGSYPGSAQQPGSNTASSCVHSAFVGHHPASRSCPGSAQQPGSAYPAPPTAVAAHADPVPDGSRLPQDVNLHPPYLEQQDTWRWQGQLGGGKNRTAGRCSTCSSQRIVVATSTSVRSFGNEMAWSGERESGGRTMCEMRWIAGRVSIP
jgi:hypothetical protein